MPPKPTKKVVGDWSWVGTEVKTVEGITEHHRVRAAGLEGTCCPFRAVQTDGKVNGDGPKCTEKRCRGSVGCLNHLGAEEAVKLSMRTYVEEHAVEGVALRDGPAGLRNLGATCYANAFLQMWYHNHQLRDGVYKAVTTNTRTPLFHLGTIFAGLDLSDRPVIDPTPLLENLELNKGDQQDAAEFATLFTQLIATAFSRSPDPEVKNLMNDMFEGRIEFQTRCLTCDTVSRSEQPFIELDVHLKNGATIQECLEAQSRPEPLDGDNKYHCQVCKSPQPALRSVKPSKFPPILNLSLMRFTYGASGRVKSKAAIKYGQELVLDGITYQLRAVLTHLGTSAHHGHFVCDVYDHERDAWLHCNDEIVTLPDRKKRRRIDSPDLDYSSSKDAYMLVYQRKRPSRPQPPPKILQDAIEADNVALQAEITASLVQRQVLEDEYHHLSGAKRDVIRCLRGRDRLVPRDELVKWLKATKLDDMFAPWDFDAITCGHGGIDPFKTLDARYISEQAYDKLATYTPLPDLSICAVCVEAEFARRVASSNHSDCIAEFDKLDLEGPYVISRPWLMAWRKHQATGSPTEDLFCVHGSRWEGAKVMTISAEAIAMLRSLKGDFPVYTDDEPLCGVCAEEYAREQEEDDERLAQVRAERGLKRLIDGTPMFGVDFYVLPEGFHEAWSAWLRNMGERPELETRLCPHGGLDWDPMMKQPHYVTEEGWRGFTERYGDTPAVVVQFGANPLRGKRTQVVSVDPDVCDECRVKRARNFETATIYIVRGEKEGLAISGKRTSRSKVKEFEVEVKKETTVKDIKLQICAEYLLSPISQRLWYDDTELDDSSATVESLGIISDDRLRLEVLHEVIDVDAEDSSTGGGVRPREGFGGTALLGSRSCPLCTYINVQGVTNCEVCGGEMG